jgi:hypothetical protein
MTQNPDITSADRKIEAAIEAFDSVTLDVWKQASNEHCLKYLHALRTHHELIDGDLEGWFDEVQRGRA